MTPSRAHLIIDARGEEDVVTLADGNGEDIRGMFMERLD